jgi:hypothetical protein
LWRKSWCFISSIKSNKLKPQKNQKMVWLLDYWVVHKNKDFLEWMKEKYSNILVVFILVNSTYAFQPIDVIM